MNNLNLWFQDVQYCNGENLIIIELAQCTIPMSQFTDPQLGYEIFEPIVVRVSASNAKGLSITPSLPSTSSATTKTIPTVMHYNCITRGETTDEATLDIRWTPLVTASDTGDSEILSYNLQYDQGKNTWVDVIGQSSYYPLTQVVLTDGIQAGVHYNFRIRALNVYGWSAQFSFPHVSIEASGKPAPMDTVTTTYDLQKLTSVKIAWTEPYDNSEPIIDYEILILQENGSLKASSECNGALDPVKS